MQSFVQTILNEIDRFNQDKIPSFQTEGIEIFDCDPLPFNWQNYTCLIEQQGDYIVKRERDFSPIYENVFDFYCQNVPSFVNYYLNDRGIDLQAGFTNSDNCLFNRYKNKPKMIQALFDMGLIKFNDRGVCDHFRNRIIFAVRDSNGKIQGLIGRKLPSDKNPKKPKYLNSTFNKSKNIWFTHKGCSSDRAFVCEGLLDSQMIGKVASCDAAYILGSSISIEQFKQLVLEYENIFFVFDGDAAGKKASEVVLELATNYLNYELNIFDFDFRVNHGNKPLSNIYIKELHNGTDPCELGYDLFDSGKLYQIN